MSFDHVIPLRRQSYQSSLNFFMYRHNTTSIIVLSWTPCSHSLPLIFRTIVTMKSFQIQLPGYTIPLEISLPSNKLNHIYWSARNKIYSVRSSKQTINVSLSYHTNANFVWSTKNTKCIGINTFISILCSMTAYKLLFYPRSGVP